LNSGFGDFGKQRCLKIETQLDSAAIQPNEIASDFASSRPLPEGAKSAEHIRQRIFQSSSKA
jgi:hypothetical protein